MLFKSFQSAAFLSLILLSPAFLSGCASTSSEAPKTALENSPVVITPTSHMTLSKSPASLIGRTLTTEVKGRQGEYIFDIMIKTQFDLDQIAFAGASSEGQIFEMLWSDSAPLKIAKSPTAEEIDVKDLLAHMQLIYWPKDQLQNNLTDLSVVDEQKTRTLYQNGVPVVLIEHQEKFIAFEHLTRRYRLTFKAMDQ